MKIEELRAALNAAENELDAAAEAIETEPDHSDFVGNCGCRSLDKGSEEEEKRFWLAKGAYAKAVRELRGYTHGPALRDYYRSSPV